MALHALHRPALPTDVAARVAAFFMPRHQHADWQIAHYATHTYSDGRLVDETPEITYGQLHGRQ